MQVSWKRLYVGTVTVCVGCLCLATGCQNWLVRKDSQGAVPSARMTSGAATPQELVGYLNDNARKLQTLECRELDLQASQANQPIGLMGQMVVQQPRSFRMHAMVAGTNMVDLGSNNDEFWFWIGKSEPPYLFHCSHQDFSQGRTKMPFPFQPDWIMEALGMAQHDPNKQYEVRNNRQSVELVEPSVTPQGQPVRKVTVFQRTPLQVTGLSIRDMTGKDICTARIVSVGHDRATGATYPRNVQLDWPADKVRLNMRLDAVNVNQNLPQDRLAALFTRPSMSGVQSYNLASGPDAPAQPLQRAGVFR